MSKSPEFPTILLITGWATAATIAAVLFATTGQPGREPETARVEQSTETVVASAPAATVEALAEAAPPPTIEPAEAAPAIATLAPLGLGRPALAEEVAAWDVAVLPDGTGLPEGSGNVEIGEEVFSGYCAACHGDFAEGLDSWPVLAGGDGTLTDPRPVKTVGSYWPYLSTVFDYVNRSMPFGGAQTLTADETYAITAYILYSNGLVDDDFTLSHENFTDIVLPNSEGFYPDDRAATEYPLFAAEPCMESCLGTAPQVTRRAVDVNVTPEDPDGKPAGTLPVITQAVTGEGVAPETTEASVTETAELAPDAAAAGVEATEAAPVQGAADLALIAAGEAAFKKCASCHKVGEGARNAIGPHLNGIVDAAIGRIEGFKYSAALADMAASGAVWDAASLDAFLENPKGFAKGTKMSFAGLNKPEEREAIIAYLSTLSGS